MDGMGKVAIVTGGSRGFGRAAAAALVADGWRVVVDGRDARSLEKAAAATGAVAVPGDVADAGHRAALLERAAHLGGIDLLVNSAGTLGPSPLPQVSDLALDALREILDVNVVAQLGLVQLALPMLRTAGGAVVNVTSDPGVVPAELVEVARK